jgi:tRNA dimethylallyltransferase
VTVPLVLVGPTASGKSAVAMAIARSRSPEVELVSVDSMQVYRGMDVGTAKPTAGERQEVRHHVLDLVDPSEDFSVADHQRAVLAALDDIGRRRRRAVLVGGTGLYVRAVVDGFTIPGQWPEVRAELEAEGDTAALHRRLADLDAVAAGRMEPTNRRRVVRALEVSLGSGRPFSSFGPGLDRYDGGVGFHLAGLRVDRDELRRRIDDRFRAMLDAGFLDEVRRLAAAPRPMSRTAAQALGYRELLRHVVEGAPLDECVEEAVTRTRQFARRQEAWFRRDPRITWYEGEIAEVAARVLGDWEDRCRTTP